MDTFLLRTNGKTGKAMAIEIKALAEKVDFSNMSEFLRLIGINDSQKDGVIRYFRENSNYIYLMKTETS